MAAPVINQRVPSDIFDRQAGWGHSASTQLNFASNQNVTVQAVWNDPYQQFQTGDANDITGAQSIQIPQIGSNSDLGFYQAQQTAPANARDGVVSATTIATSTTHPTGSFNSTYNGVTTSTTYSTLASKQTNTINYGGTAVLGTTDLQQGNFATILADRFYGWGHGSATTFAAAYNTSTTIAVSAPGLTTYEQTPFDNAPNQANYQPQTPNPLLGQRTASHLIGAAGVNMLKANVGPVLVASASNGQALTAGGTIWVQTNPANSGFSASGTLAVFDPYTDNTYFVAYTSTAGGASNNFQGCTYNGIPWVLTTGQYIYQAVVTETTTVPVSEYLDPSWGGINDRKGDWGHLTGGGNTVTVAGQSVSVPAMHD